MEKSNYESDMLEYHSLLSSNDCPLSNEGTDLLRKFLKCIDKVDNGNLRRRVSIRTDRKWAFRPLIDLTDKRYVTFRMRKNVITDVCSGNDLWLMVRFIDVVAGNLKVLYLLGDETLDCENIANKYVACLRFKEEIVKQG